MKKTILIILVVILVLGVVMAAGGYFMFRNEIRAAGTVSKISDTKNLYTMEYFGDYGFDKFLAEGGASSSDEVAVFLTQFISKGFYKYELEQTSSGCSTISAVSPAGEFIFGRDFDWENSSCMVVKTVPPKGYSSISTVNLDFLGYGGEYQPDSFGNSFLALGAPFVPLDGMNEMGLCVADLVIDDAGETHQDSGKPDLTTTTGIRLILDYAATVDEAVELLKQYDMHSDIGTMHHLAVSDIFGRSVVIEYINNVMHVTETNVVTNFYITEGEKFGFGSDSSKERFKILQDTFVSNKGILSDAQIKAALINVAQSAGFDAPWSTQWSVIYNQTSGKSLFYYNEDYDTEYVFSVK